MYSCRIPSVVAERVRPQAVEVLEKVKAFVEDECKSTSRDDASGHSLTRDTGIPADEVFESQLGTDPAQRMKTIPPILDDLKQKARKLGLWNLWLSSHYEEGAGFTNLEYGLMCEQMGRSRVAAESMNCSAPDTGNMEVLAKYGSRSQKERWLSPLLDGEIRSSFVMTERRVASSYAKNLSLSMRRDGDEYVLDGTKWWISSAADPRNKLWIVFARSNPESSNPNKQHSVILVEPSSQGVKILRSLNVFGFDDAPLNHCEVEFVNVRVPAANIVLGEGRGFEVMQGRMGPGRIHHCMRAIGCAERGLEYMIARATARMVNETSLAEHGVIADWIARSRIEIDAGRMLVLEAAHKMDCQNAKAAMAEIAMSKIYVPNMALQVLDKAMQTHGAGGICSDFPLARIWAYLRTTRIADGPDEAHIAQLARIQLRSAEATISKLSAQDETVDKLAAMYKTGRARPRL